MRPLRVPGMREDHGLSRRYFPRNQGFHLISRHVEDLRTIEYQRFFLQSTDFYRHLVVRMQRRVLSTSKLGVVLT